ncbi:MAG: methyl-accepting chemotaxis protein [Clostridia bacterium]|nr:methyl-accepting chemotaxis protein [Clostridia bacterium]
MKTSGFSSLKMKNSLILIGVMIPLLAIFLTFDVIQQSEALRNALTARGIILAQTGATFVSKVLSDAVKHGVLTQEEIFDKNYIPIPNTNPQKYNTKYDAYTDDNLREVIDSFLKDKVIVYATAVDTNGYLPTHNSIFSQVGKGLNFDRSKRIFDDLVANAANRNQKPYLFQQYNRDTGEIMWDISSPIYVDGRRWGTFRIGFSIEETEKQIAALVQQELLAGLVFTLALILLAVYISNRISNPVKLLVEEANRVAEGDLSLSELPTGSRDEVGRLLHSFGRMVIKLRDLVEKSRYSTRMIAAYTRDLLQNTENATGTVNTVATKMTQVTEAMNKLTEGAERVIETSHRVSENLAEAEVNAGEFIDSMEMSKNAMYVAQDVVKELEAQVEKVGSVVQVVNILAEQSGLMAQKAAREAEFACNMESDFGNLAADVQNRAVEAAETTREVLELCQAVKTHAKLASGALENHRQVIIKGIQVARLSANSLTAIVSDLRSLTGLTKEVLQSSRELIGGVKNVNLDVEAQAALVKRFVDAAGTLEQVVDELQETLNNLKV